MPAILHQTIPHTKYSFVDVVPAKLNVDFAGVAATLNEIIRFLADFGLEVNKCKTEPILHSVVYKKTSPRIKI